MKEMPIFEEVLLRLVRQPGVAVKILIGAVLSFIPIVNLLAFGYIYRFSIQIRESGRLSLPAWDDWQLLLLDGVKVILVWILYFFFPVVVVFGLSVPIGMIGLSALSYVLVSMTVLGALIFFCAALYRLQTRSVFQNLLEFASVARMSYTEWPRFIVPALFSLGVIALCFPLYGLASFAALIPLVAYTTLCFRVIEHRKM